MKQERTTTVFGGDPPSRRFLCNSEHPWTPLIKGPVEHEETREVGEQRDGRPGGDLVNYRCVNCGHTWTEELPQ